MPVDECSKQRKAAKLAHERLAAVDVQQGTCLIMLGTHAVCTLVQLRLRHQLCMLQASRLATPRSWTVSRAIHKHVHKEAHLEELRAHRVCAHVQLRLSLWRPGRPSLAVHPSAAQQHLSNELGVPSSSGHSVPLEH